GGSYILSAYVRCAAERSTACCRSAALKWGLRDRFSRYSAPQTKAPVSGGRSRKKSRSCSRRSPMSLFYAVARERVVGGGWFRDSWGFGERLGFVRGGDRKGSFILGGRYFSAAGGAGAGVGSAEAGWSGASESPEGIGGTGVT